MTDRHQECPLCGDTAFEPLPEFRRTELTQCLGCRAVFAPTIPTHEELVAHYSGYPRAQKQDSAVSRKRRLEILESFEPYRKTGKMLDVGCDIGLFLNQARDLGWATYGTEFMEEAVEICEANGHTMHLGPLLEAELEPGTFDVVIYTEVIEHITSQRQEFPYVFELLRPGGLLYVTTPNFDSVSRRVLGDRWEVIEYPEHLVYFTPSTLTEFMKRVGFEEVWVESSGVSISRLMSSLDLNKSPAEKAGPREPTRARKRDISADEAIRNSMEKSPALGIAKNVVNGLLDATATGDAIKAGFRKPADFRAE